MDFGLTGQEAFAQWLPCQKIVSSSNPSLSLILDPIAMPPSAANTATLKMNTKGESYATDTSSSSKAYKTLLILITGFENLRILLAKNTHTDNFHFTPLFASWQSSSLFSPCTNIMSLLRMKKHNIIPTPPQKSPPRRTKLSKSTIKVPPRSTSLLFFKRGSPNSLVFLS